MFIHAKSNTITLTVMMNNTSVLPPTQQPNNNVWNLTKYLVIAKSSFGILHTWLANIELVVAILGMPEHISSSINTQNKRDIIVGRTIGFHFRR